MPANFAVAGMARSYKWFTQMVSASKVQKSIITRAFIEMQTFNCGF